MTELVHRLRAWRATFAAIQGTPCPALETTEILGIVEDAEKAADEIERLRAGVTKKPGREPMSESETLVTAYLKAVVKDGMTSIWFETEDGKPLQIAYPFPPLGEGHNLRLGPLRIVVSTTTT